MSRDLPSVPFSVQKSDPGKAAVDLQQAQLLLWQAETQGADKSVLGRRRAAVTRARKKVEACYETHIIKALPAESYEEVIEAHPPTPEQVEAAGKSPDERPEWNGDTFYPALLEACVDGDKTAEDWAVFLKDLTRGELRQLKYALIALNENERLPESMMLPKGSPGIGNLL